MKREKLMVGHIPREISLCGKATAYQKAQNLAAAFRLYRVIVFVVVVHLFVFVSPAFCLKLKLLQNIF